MPEISFFADDQDIKCLVDRLNTDPEIAFIVADGLRDPHDVYMDRLRRLVGDRTRVTSYLGATAADSGYRQRWKAVGTVESLRDGKHCLWHVPGNPLTLLTDDSSNPDISDPWAGWTEQRGGADPTTPFFGSRHSAVIYLELWTRHHCYSETEKATLPMLDSFWNDDHDMLVVSDFSWIDDHYHLAPLQTHEWWR